MASRGLFRLVLLCLAVGLGPGGGSAPAAGGESPKDAAEAGRVQIAIDQAIQQLGADDWKTRAAATEALWKIGRAAEPALRRAAESKDTEVAFRAKSVLEKFRWGILPETPKEVLALIDEYRQADKDGRQAVRIRIADRNDDAALDALKSIAVGEEDDSLHSAAEESFAGTLIQKAVPRLLCQGRDERAEALLEYAAFHIGTSHSEVADQCMRAYAAYLHAFGRLSDERIELLEKRRAAAGDEPARRRLDYLLAAMHRVRGDLPKALAAVERVGNPRARMAALLELGRWKDLLDEEPRSGEPLPLTVMDRRFLKACHADLAGDRAALEAVSAEIVGHADETDPRRTAAFLILHGRGEEAAKKLAGSSWPFDAAYVYSSMCLFRESWDATLSLAQAAAGPGGPSPEYFLISVTGTQARAGAIDRIKDLLTESAARTAKEDVYPVTTNILLDALRETGLKDVRAELIAALMAKTTDCSVGGNYLGNAVDCHADTGYAWWTCLAILEPDQTAAPRLARMESILHCQVTGAAFAELVAKAAKAAEPLENPWARRTIYNGLAKTCRQYGRTDLAVEYQKRRAEIPERYDGCEYADLLAETGKHAEAVEAYRRTSLDHPTEAAMIWRMGKSLDALGRRDEARRAWAVAGLIDQLLLPGENALPELLADEGLAKEAAEAALARVHAARRLSREWTTAAFQAAARLQAVGRLEEAEQLAYQAAAAHLLDEGPWVIDSVLTGLELRAAEALRSIELRQWDEAVKAADRLIVFSDWSSEQLIEVVRALDKAGQQKLADDIIARYVAKMEQVNQRHPRARCNLNNTAWVLACTRRRLDLAEKLARRAWEIYPWSPYACGTLSEVLFQRGKRDEAAEAVRQAIRICPDKRYYHRQLARVQKGDPASPPGQAPE